MAKGQAETVPVEVGAGTDSQIEVISGLNEGDAVVTNPNLATSSQSASGGSRSVFGGMGGGAVFRAR
jgi:hypothetical protein